MSLTVETGAGLPNADSYASLADADAYMASMGSAGWAGQDAAREGALRRATRFLDWAYAERFPGTQRRFRVQALQWPRVGATVAYQGGPSGLYTLPEDAVPREVREATMEAALAELAKPGSLAPNIKQGGAITSVTAGPVGVTFGGGGLTGQTVFQNVELALARILSPASAYGGRAVRC